MASHNPDVAEQKQLRARALEIGNTLEASAVDELFGLLKCRFPEVRRLAAYARKHHWCTRCRRRINEEDFMRGMELFGKPYCLHCLDERILESKNFEIVVNEAKAKRTEDGTAVQSQGERRIADYLSLKGVRYVYDERYRMAGDVRIRPDFYLPEFDLYIEYWGMDTPEYVENMKKKLFLYQRAGKKLISLSFRDFDRLEAILEEKLSRYIRL